MNKKPTHATRQPRRSSRDCIAIESSKDHVLKACRLRLFLQFARPKGRKSPKRAKAFESHLVHMASIFTRRNPVPNYTIHPRGFDPMTTGPGADRESCSRHLCQRCICDRSFVLKAYLAKRCVDACLRARARIDVNTPSACSDA